MEIIAPWSQFSQRGSPTPLREFHRHNDMELTLLRSGRLTYEMNGRCAPIPPGRLCLLWGGIPHRWAEWSPAIDLQVLCLPMSFFLRLKLPSAFVHALLTGHVIAESDGAREVVDDHLMREWAENIASGRQDLRKVVEMEIEARLHRLALTQPRKGLHPRKPGGEDALARLLGTFCEGATEGCPVEELCRRARLHPKYAMKLFRRECGMTLLQYLHQLRVSHAQRLLMTTGEQILDIALAAGFGSAASFYEIFKKETGAKPSAFRNAEGGQETTTHLRDGNRTKLPFPDSRVG